MIKQPNKYWNDHRAATESALQSKNANAFFNKYGYEPKHLYGKSRRKNIGGKTVDNQ